MSSTRAAIKNLKVMKKLFLASSINFVIEDIVKYLIKPAKELSLVFIPTAAEVEKGDLQWLEDDRNALIKVGFKVFDYTITGKSEDKVRERLKGIDVVFVSGGNGFYLLEQVYKSGFDKVVSELVEQGVVYISSSAGSVIAGPDIEITKRLDDPMLAKELDSYKGIGLVDFIVLPHWGGEHFKDRYSKTATDMYKEGLKIILLTDDQYVMVEEDRYKIIDVNQDQ